MPEMQWISSGLNEDDRALIREMAEAIARHHRLPVGRVYPVCERLAFVSPEPPFPPAFRPSGSDTRRVWFSPAFQRALSWLEPRAALELFERNDPLVLHRRSILVGHLRHPMVPFLTRDELAEVIDACIRHRRVNRDYLIRTGWPGTSFPRSPWLDWHLSPLYPTRIPARVFDTDTIFVDPEGQPLLRDEEGNVEYAGSSMWSMAPDPDLEPERWQTVPGTEPLEVAAQTCRYEEAPLLPGLTHDLARFLEEHRDEFLHLKLDVMAACRDAVRARDADQLWQTLWSLLTARFGVEQLWQFLEADELYRRLRLLPVMAMRCGTVLPANISGGLTDLLRLVAHCETEIRLGHMDRTKRRLLRTPAELVDIGCYFQAVQHPLVALLDEILDQYWDDYQAQGGFWHQFGQRVRRAFEEEAGKVPVSITRRVERALAQPLEEALQSFADFHLSQLRSPGARVVFQIAAPASGNRPASGYSLRKGGQYWIAFFEDEVAVFKDNEIARMLAFLIRHQGQSFHVIHAVMGAAGTLGPDSTVASQGSTVAQRAEEGIPGGTPKSQPLADPAFLKGLREMIDRKKAEISEAKGLNDAERALILEEELAEWEGHLQGYEGKGGKSREFSDDASAAQQRLSEAFRRLWRGVEPDAPKFARHLQNDVHLGMAGCSYRPHRWIPWDE